MTKKTLKELFFTHSQYVDSRTGNAINEENWDKLAEAILNKTAKKKKTSK